MSAKRLDLVRIANQTVLVAWIWLFVSLLLPLTEGQHLTRYLRADLWWLVVVGGGIATLFLVVTLAHPPPADQKQPRLKPLLRPLFLMVPLPFFLLVGDTGYGSLALRNRLSLSAAARGGNLPSLAVPQTLPVPDAGADSLVATDLLALAGGWERFANRQVSITGMVHTGPDIPAGHLYCFRYVMVCCAADAMPVGVFIELPPAGAPPDDTWIEAHGIPVADSLDGYFVVKLTRATFTTIDRPHQPWLYPY